MKLLTLLAALLAVVSLAACGAAPPNGPSQANSGPQITVEEPFILPSTPNGAAYFTLTNHGSTGDVLLSVKTEVAEAAEMHESKVDANDVMRMSPLLRLDVPAGGSVRLEPGGKHVMLTGLKPGLANGDKVSLTLTFELSGPLTVEAEVREGGVTGHEGHTGHE
jgi:hypothetical protein